MGGWLLSWSNCKKLWHMAHGSRLHLAQASHSARECLVENVWAQNYPFPHLWYMQKWWGLGPSCGEGNGTPLQYSCLENTMDGEAWWAAVHGVTKSRAWLRDFTFIFHFHALEKEMATHSSVLAWRIPGTGESAGLPSMGLHRVGHDWSDLAAAGPSCCLKNQSGTLAISGQELGMWGTSKCQEDRVLWAALWQSEARRTNNSASNGRDPLGNDGSFRTTYPFPHTVYLYFNFFLQKTYVMYMMWPIKIRHCFLLDFSPKDRYYLRTRLKDSQGEGWSGWSTAGRRSNGSRNRNLFSSAHTCPSHLTSVEPEGHKNHFSFSGSPHKQVAC